MLEQRGQCQQQVAQALPNGDAGHAQALAARTPHRVPVMYGVDSVHGANYVESVAGYNGSGVRVEVMDGDPLGWEWKLAH